MYTTGMEDPHLAKTLADKNITRLLKTLKPCLMIVAAENGAGKSSLINILKKDNNIIIDNDEIRARLPNIEELYEGHNQDWTVVGEKYTQEATKLVTKRFIENKHNIILQETLRTKRIFETLEEAQDLDYNIHESLVGVISRYFFAKLEYANGEDVIPPRYIKIEQHHKAHDKLKEHAFEISSKVNKIKLYKKIKKGGQFYFEDYSENLNHIDTEINSDNKSFILEKIECIKRDVALLEKINTLNAFNELDKIYLEKTSEINDFIKSIV
jgi:predicted ABC-type ATPase